ncbi:uncharacterized protein METZ01_LOCUS272822 [marine metagenome]|uniref:Uncharacterized protein n=1 Tax=marine metagenome TaxID=408172 RepID=A0A382K6N6_9ZZZZ
MRQKTIAINLISHNEYGEGSITIKDRFANDSYLFKLDCLQDWIDLLDLEYRKTWKLYGKELKKLIPKKGE